MTTATIFIEHNISTGAVEVTVSGDGEALEVADQMMAVAAVIQGDNLIGIETFETH